MTIQPKCIYWIRHAESCANLLENKIVDTYDNLEFKTRHTDSFKEYASKPSNYDLDIKKNILILKDTEDLKDPGIKYIIMKNLDLINNNIECDKKIFLSAPESKWLFHPCLSAIGILQAQKLHISNIYKEIVDFCNVFITSATVRTIMTAIYSLLGYRKKITLYIVPCINEKLNEASCLGLDYANIGIPKDKIDTIIEHIIQYVDASVISLFKKDHTFIIGNITIDTNFYINNDNHPNNTTLNAEELLKTNIYRFKNQIIQELSIETHIPIHEMSIMAYTHGYLISDLLQHYRSDYIIRNPYAPNVSMFREMDNNMNVVIVDDEAPNGGVFIRKYSPYYLDNDMLDSSPCKLFGFRGDINKLLHSSILFNGGNKKKKIKRNSKKKQKLIFRRSYKI
jgi:hypothetical protein